MKPLDIDGNELKVGDDVELVVSGKSPITDPDPFGLGGRFLVNEIISSEEINARARRAGMNVKVEVGMYVGIEHRWKKSDQVRLIPRDTKAPTKIEFVTTKEGVR
jgi:hypothetical protein